MAAGVRRAAVASRARVSLGCFSVGLLLFRGPETRFTQSIFINIISMLSRPHNLGHSATTRALIRATCISPLHPHYKTTSSCGRILHALLPTNKPVQSHPP